MPKSNGTEETFVRRFERELKDFFALFRRSRAVAMLLLITAAAYAAFSFWPPGEAELSNANAAENRNEIAGETIGNPARIRNPLGISVMIAVGGGTFTTVQAGAELPVPAPAAGLVVRLHSCGWGTPECKERQYPIFAGQQWDVVFEDPHPRIGLQQRER